MPEEETTPEGEERAEEESGERTEEEGKEDQPKAKKTAKIGQMLSAKAMLFLFIGLIVGAIAVYALLQPGPAPDDGLGTVGMAALRSDLTSYFNENLFFEEGVEAKIDSVESFNESLYLVKIDILRDGLVEQRGEVFLTKDGKTLIFGQKNMTIFLLDEPPPPPETEPEPTTYLKSDKPEVRLFVWSFCPGGTVGEAALKPVVDLLGGDIDAKVVFIGPVTSDEQDAASGCFSGRGKALEEALDSCCAAYDDIDGETVYSCALHNEPDNKHESYESARQACIQKYFPGKLWDYIEAFNSSCLVRGDYDACWREQATALGIDAAKIEQCSTSADGIRLLMADNDLSNQLSINVSPSLYINGTKYGGSTSAVGYKEAICSVFNTAPGECGQEVSAASGSGNSNVTCG